MIAGFLKKLLWTVVIFIALDAGIVYALPKFVPMDKVASLVQDKVREQTGRDVAFSGVNFVFWPDFGVELRQVTLGNPAWAQQKNMVSLGKADVQLELLPLLQRHIVVKKLVLNQPEIYLETAADGKRNWIFSPDTSSAPAAAPQRRKSVAAPGQKFDFQFGRLQISKGRLIYADQRKGTATSVEDINLDVILPDLKSPIRVKGTLVFRGKRLALDLDLDKPLDFFEGRSSSGQISLKADDFTLKADGALDTKDTLLKGDMEGATSDLPKVLAWARNTAEQKLPFEKLAFSGDAHLTRSDIILKEATLTLDDVQARGDLDAGFTGVPELFARLSLNKLNLDRFTGGGAAGSVSGASNGKEAAPSGGGEEWSTTPLDFSGLKKLNADLKLQTQGFTLRGAEVGPSVLAVQLQGGELHFTSSEATLFGGKFSSDMKLNASTATPTMSFSFSMSGVQAQPVLATFMHFKKLSGDATAHVSLTAAGDSQKEIISSLEGSGTVDFKNGELQGIDMVKIARLVQDHSSKVGVDDGATKFVDVTGAFSIVKGIVSNTDMKMKGAVVQATGQGIVDLPKKYIQYKAIPVLVTSAAPGTAPGLSVPVNIKGPFSDIRVVPDFVSTVKEIIKNPSAAKTALKNIRDNLLRGGVFGKLALPPKTAPAQ